MLGPSIEHNLWPPPSWHTRMQHYFHKESSCSMEEAGAGAHLKTLKGFWSEEEVGAQRRRMKGFPVRLRLPAQ